MKKINIKNLIFAVIFLAITVSSFYFTFRQMNIYHSKFIDLTNLYKEKENKTNEIKALDKLISEIGKEIKLIDSHFLKTEDIAPFLDELELNAKELGIKGEVVSVDNITTTDKSLYLNIKAEGTFDNLYKFLKLLENYKYELEIVDFKIVKENSSNLDNINGLPNWTSFIKIKIISLIN